MNCRRKIWIAEKKIRIAEKRYGLQKKTAYKISVRDKC